MGINWDYDKDVKEKSFEPVPVGEYRCRIEIAEEAKSKNGNDMIIIELAVSGHSQKLWYYLVFMPDHKDITNANLKAIYECFKIDEGNLKTSTWIGKVGGLKVKHEVYNGESKPKVHYFLNQEKQLNLPPWGDVAETQSEPKGEVDWD